MSLSKDQFADIIAKHSTIHGLNIDGAADDIWALVAAYIEATEDRIIDAEFKANDFERRFKNAMADGD